MPRTTDNWMEFNGLRSSAMGVMVVDLPNRSRAGVNGEAITMPGRHGDVWMNDGSYAPIEVDVGLKTLPGADLSAIAKWLSGVGHLRFSDAADYVYRARATREFVFITRAPGAGGQWFRARFSCQPFLYRAVPTSHVPLNGATVTNAGNIASFPMIQLTGTGTIALSVGVQSLVVTALSGQINIDCETRIATSTGGLLLTNQLTPPDDWAMLRPGANVVSWTGNVSNIRVYDNSAWF